MVELSKERVETILKEETQKTTELATVLRAIYTRYMNLYEKYFADIDALNNDKIAEMNRYHEETMSLVKYYYMDIPHDVCIDIKEFDEKYGSKLLGPSWHKYLFDYFEDFQDKNWDKSEEWVKKEFKKQTMDAFYEAMGDVFRQGFGTESKTHQSIVSGISSLLFGGGSSGKDKK